MTKLNHGCTGRGLALLVFAVPSSSTVPGLGAFDHPTLPQGRKTGAPLGACRDFETPRGTMDGHPGVQIVMMVFIVPTDRREAWEGCGRDQGEQLRGRLAIIKPCAGNPHGNEQSEGVHEEMTLTALHFLAAVLPALRTADLGGLHRLTIDAESARGWLAAHSHAGLFA